MAKIELNVDGKAHSIDADADMPLLYALRDDLGLKNPKFGCGLAQCGACTVLIDGEPVRSCATPVDSVAGRKVVTMGGLIKDGKPHTVQQAFIDAGAFQCGFCTSGFIMMTKKLLEENPHPTEEEIRHYLVGNLCRCSAYPEIIDAVKALSRRAG